MKNEYMIKENPVAGFTLFYLEKTVIEPINEDFDIPSVNLELKSKILPIELKDKFIEKYGTKLLTITGPEIEEFIRNNRNQ